MAMHFRGQDRDLNTTVISIVRPSWLQMAVICGILGLIAILLVANLAISLSLGSQTAETQSATLKTLQNDLQSVNRQINTAATQRVDIYRNLAGILATRFERVEESLAKPPATPAPSPAPVVNTQPFTQAVKDLGDKVEGNHLTVLSQIRDLPKTLAGENPKWIYEATCVVGDKTYRLEPIEGFVESTQEVESELNKNGGICTTRHPLRQSLTFTSFEGVVKVDDGRFVRGGRDVEVTASVLSIQYLPNRIDNGFSLRRGQIRPR